MYEQTIVNDGAPQEVKLDSRGDRIMIDQSLPFKCIMPTSFFGPNKFTYKP